MADGDDIIDVASSITEIIKIQGKLHQLDELKESTKKLLDQLKKDANYPEEDEEFSEVDFLDGEELFGE